MKWLRVALLILLPLVGLPVVSQQSQQPTQQSTQQAVPSSQKVQPKMRAVDRDWQYFKAVSCDDINQIVFHSRSEEMLLAKRKSQCLNKYKAFLPVPIDR